MTFTYTGEWPPIPGSSKYEAEDGLTVMLDPKHMRISLARKDREPSDDDLAAAAASLLDPSFMLTEEVNFVRHFSISTKPQAIN